MAEERGERRTCPRCGEPYSYVDVRAAGESRVYYYAVHYRRESGARRVKKCYLGPSEYEYVTRLHERESLVLRGLVDSDRVIEYLNAIVEYLERNPLEPELAEKLADKFRVLASKLEAYARGGAR